MRGDEFCQLVEYVTEDGVFDVPLDVFALDSAATLEGIAADYAKAVTLGRAKTIDAQAVATKAAEIYAPEVIEAEISSDPVQTFDRLAWILSRPEWRPGMDVTATDVVGVRIEGKWTLYEVVQAHSTEAGWEPESAKALFARWYNPDEPEPWVQPTGAQDAYRAGMRVLHAGYTWVSTINANVWEPGSVGAEALWTREGEPEPEPDVTPEWVSGEQLTYSAANPIYRMYQGVKYQLRQSPGVNIWAPPTVPALWQVVPT